jgi:hypothetical protein
VLGSAPSGALLGDPRLDDRPERRQSDRAVAEDDVVEPPDVEGFVFLTRAPLAFAIPFYALLLAGDRVWERRRWPWRTWAQLAVGVGPSIAFFFWYNDARFGSPLESGYGLALLPAWLEAQRQHGLFSSYHVPMNLYYLFGKIPKLIDTFPFFQPDGLGMSIFITSPGLLYAVRAPWRTSRVWWLAGAALLVLIPTLLYYGGGWLQYGYRYALDSIPFLWAVCALAAARDEDARESVGLGGAAIGLGWRWLILSGSSSVSGASIGPTT